MEIYHSQGVLLILRYFRLVSVQTRDFHQRSTDLRLTIAWGVPPECDRMALIPRFDRCMQQKVGFAITYIQSIRALSATQSRRYSTVCSYTTTYMTSYFLRTIREWNSLPPHLIELNTLATFLNLIEQHL